MTKEVCLQLNCFSSINYFPLENIHVSTMFLAFFLLFYKFNRLKSWHEVIILVLKIFCISQYIKPFFRPLFHSVTFLFVSRKYSLAMSEYRFTNRSILVFIFALFHFRIKPIGNISFCSELRSYI